MKSLKLITLSAAMLLLSAAPALAGTVRYDVPATPAYTVDGNGTGIVKVEYNACVISGARQTLQFTSTVRGTTDSVATWELIGNVEPGEAATFTPPTVAVRQNVDVVNTVTLSFVPAIANNPDGEFRIQLNGEPGLGNGPGIAVKINCVLPAVGAAPGAGSTSVLPSVPQAIAKGTAPCLSISSVRLRAGERRRVRARVLSGAMPVFGAIVRARGAGVNKSGRTDANGYVTLSLRPTRAGTIYFQTNVCAGADRKRVLAAFRSRTRNAPVTTG